MLSAAGIALVAAIKPHIQQRIDESLTQEVNRQLEQSPKLVAISKLSPVDLAIIEGRQYVRRKYDPYVIDNVFNYDSEYLTLKLGPVTVRGLSRFTRIGNVKFGFVNRTMVVKMHLLTGRLSGDVKFEFNFGKVGPGRIGESKFSVHHLQFEAIVKQPLNLGKKPILDDLQLEVGKISVQMDGKGRFDYMLELAMQFLPNILRHFIIDALEEPLKQRIQSDILDKVDAEKLIFENLPLLEKLFFKDAN